MTRPRNGSPLDHSLDRRDLRMLVLIDKGWSLRQIAEATGVSVMTVSRLRRAYDEVKREEVGRG